MWPGMCPLACAFGAIVPRISSPMNEEKMESSGAAGSYRQNRIEVEAIVHRVIET